MRIGPSSLFTSMFILLHKAGFVEKVFCVMSTLVLLPKQACLLYSNRQYGFKIHVCPMLMSNVLDGASKLGTFSI